MYLFKRLANIWLNFSRGERNGIMVLTVVLLLMIFINTIIPYLPPRKISREQKEQLLFLADSMRRVQNSFSPVSFSSFDPNTLQEDDWRRIGLSGSQARMIVRYREAGGHFNAPEDLYRIYGIDSAWVRSIIPYIQIAQNGRERKETAGRAKNKAEQMLFPGDHRPKTKEKPHYKGEINTTDSATLVMLYGIGPVMARRIINYRTRLGGFVSMEQLREIYGIRPEMLQVLNEHYQCDSLHIKKIPVNRVTENELILHPYLSRWNAYSILKYREIRGKIIDVNELKKNHILPDSVFWKIYPYLSVD